MVLSTAGRGRRADLADRAAQGRRRARLRLLHQPAVAQGPRPRRQPPGLAALPLAPDAAPGRRRRRRRAGGPRRGSRLLLLAPLRLPSRRVGQRAVVGHRLARRAQGEVRRAGGRVPRHGQRRRRAAARRVGRLRGAPVAAWSSGRGGPRACTTGCATCARPRTPPCSTTPRPGGSSDSHPDDVARRQRAQAQQQVGVVDAAGAQGDRCRVGCAGSRSATDRAPGRAGRTSRRAARAAGARRHGTAWRAVAAPRRRPRPRPGAPPPQCRWVCTGCHGVESAASARGARPAASPCSPCRARTRTTPRRRPRAVAQLAHAGEQVRVVQAVTGELHVHAAAPCAR